MKKRKNWIVKAWNWIAKTCKKIKHKIGNRIENNLLFISILTPLILIGIRRLLLVFWSECYNPLRDWIGLDFYQIILMAGAVIGLLWTNKRYKQGQENLKQNNFFEGLNNLTDKDSLKVEIGVQQLQDLSKTNPEYNKGIKLAFIKRLKRRPEKESLSYFSFGQYIIDWLSKNFEGKKLDLKGCNLYEHEFVIKPNFAIFKNKENTLDKLSFRNADLRGVDLTKAHLTEADLTDAYLKEADLTGANLTGANLRGANLRGANLRGAYLTGAYLTGADLTEADLKKADLTGADFNISSLNTLSRNQLDSAKNVTEITIYIHSKKKSYFLKEFVEMNPTNSINDKDFQLKEGEMFDYFVELSKKN